MGSIPLVPLSFWPVTQVSTRTESHLLGNDVGGDKLSSFVRIDETSMLWGRFHSRSSNALSGQIHFFPKMIYLHETYISQVKYTLRSNTLCKLRYTFQYWNSDQWLTGKTPGHSPVTFELCIVHFTLSEFWRVYLTWESIWTLTVKPASGLWLCYAALQNLIPGAIQGKEGIKFCHLATMSLKTRIPSPLSFPGKKDKSWLPTGGPPSTLTRCSSRCSV